MNAPFVFGVILVLSSMIHAALPEDPNEYAAWEKRSLDAIARYSTYPADKAIPEIALRMIQLSRPHSPNWEKGDRPVFHAAQAALLSIPGHAEYFRDQINEARAKVEEAKAGTSISNVAHYRGLLSNEVRYGFPTLSHLPSVETVGVLGEFLFDERGYVRPPPQPTLSDLELVIVDSPVFRRAADALSALPIENKPVSAEAQFLFPEDVLPWRQWYEEIKSGKRTFRFEGDPTEYDLKGPAPKEKLERIARDHKRDAERTSGRKAAGPSSAAITVSANEKPPKTAPIAVIISGVVLLGSLIWYFAKERTLGIMKPNDRKDATQPPARKSP